MAIRTQQADEITILRAKVAELNQQLRDSESLVSSIKADGTRYQDHIAKLQHELTEVRSFLSFISFACVIFPRCHEYSRLDFVGGERIFVNVHYCKNHH